jgi:hypothetical protein
MKSTAELINDYRNARMRGDWKEVMLIALTLKDRDIDVTPLNRKIDEKRHGRLIPDPPEAA